MCFSKYLKRFWAKGEILCVTLQQVRGWQPMNGFDWNSLPKLEPPPNGEPIPVAPLGWTFSGKSSLAHSCRTADCLECDQLSSKK